MGQEAHPDTVDVVGGQAESLREVTVQGKRVESATAPTHGFDQARLQREGITSVADAAHRLPGVTLRDYGGAGGLKTVSVRGFGSGHTAVVYDGVTLNDAQSGQIDISRYSIDDVANLSLVVGDNSDIFMPARQAASAATFSISTLSEPAYEPSLTAQLRAGSWGYVNPFVRMAAPISHSASVSLTGEYTYAENDYPFTIRNGSATTTERRSNSRMSSGRGEANLAWTPASAVSLTAKVYYYDNDRRLPGPVVYYNNSSNEALHDRNAFAQANCRATLSSVLSLMAIAKFNFASSFYSDRNGKYPGGILDQRYWQREYYASASLLWLPAEGFAADYSADFSLANLNSSLPTDIRPRRFSALQSLSGRYKSQRITAMARIICSAYDNGASRPGATAAANALRLSPSASISAKLLASHELYGRLSYKNIFRMPTFNEAYFDHYGSADILPENANQINAGLSYSPSPSSWMPRAAISVDAYANYVTDMIVAVPYNMFVWRMVNLGKVRVLGIDATMAAQFRLANGHELSLSGNYSLQRAAPRTSRESADWMKQVAYIPLHSGAWAVSWENPWACLAINGTAVSHRYTSNTNAPATRIAGYAEFGASAWRQQRLGKADCELRISVLNILDKQYQVVASYPMPGRSFQIAFKVKI